MKCSRIESVEDAFERVMGWNSVAELKKTSQPVTAFPAECRNLLPIFSATYDRTQCDDDNIEQLMFLVSIDPRVFNAAKMMLDGKWGSQGNSFLKSELNSARIIRRIP